MHEASDGVIHALGFKHPSLGYYATQPIVHTDDRAASATDIQQHPGVVYVYADERRG